MTAPGFPEGGEPAGATALTREQRRERRRRRRAERVFDSSVPSPCISVCQIDHATGLCIGCRRSLDEIRDWPILTAEEKRALLARLAERDGTSGAS